MEIEPDDVVILGSDGIFDNVPIPILVFAFNYAVNLMYLNKYGTNMRDFSHLLLNDFATTYATLLAKWVESKKINKPS